MVKVIWIKCIVFICLLNLPLMAATEVSQRVKIFETDCNTYVYIHENLETAILIDPGSRSKELEEFVAENSLIIAGIVNTHGHGDHIGANGFYAELYKTKIYAHPADEAGYRNKVNKPTDWLNPENEFLDTGKIKIQILQTPGHSQGSIGLLIGDILFSGDTLFYKSIGRTWGDDKDQKTQQELDNIRKKFFTLPSETFVFPGHGISTTIEHEIEYNPFLN